MSEIDSGKGWGWGTKMISPDYKRPEYPENKPKLSIVVPAYNEEGNLAKLCAELMTLLPLLNMSWEIILVDDGSTDNTWQEIVSLHKEDSRVKGIRLSRNFGHQYALLAGLSQADGMAIVTMDADLQHPPHVIPTLVDEWLKGKKIVHTIRTDPEDFSFLKTIASQFFYKLFSLLSGVALERGMADFRLVDRQVLDNILAFRDQDLFLRGLFQWVGFPSSQISFQSGNRFAGTTKYTFTKMVQFGWDGISSFSLIPLRVGVFIGILTSALAFGALVFAVYSKVITGTVVPGWASAVSIVSFLFGILFILVGLLGEYVGRVFVQVRARPRFLITDTLGVTPHTATPRNPSVVEYV